MCKMASEESRSPVMELRSEVFNRFIELKLRSAVHEDTGYVSSVLTPGYIDSWIVGWIGLIKCLY